ncbi:hypothetical protein CYY_002138 [Polysphondylium violaceum]|uniref:Uncharacterized protein n=1 Tax=Polysphondylium violaceum TaxID=133409 RepID=A0A8J4Q1V5_9MYCE|nr:hypothetical protein CYY_002138 [Polysphondylium violaceum]
MCHDKSVVIKKLKGLYQHRYDSLVIEECVENGSAAKRILIMKYSVTLGLNTWRGHCVFHNIIDTLTNIPIRRLFIFLNQKEKNKLILVGEYHDFKYEISITHSSETPTTSETPEIPTTPNSQTPTTSSAPDSKKKSKPLLIILISALSLIGYLLFKEKKQTCFYFFHK